APSNEGAVFIFAVFFAAFCACKDKKWAPGQKITSDKLRRLTNSNHDKKTKTGEREMRNKR
ncbi:MAG: hypothetical protein J6X72_04790, partial [Clostridia bacterium]|nr:hypothetical protein [Clostridia bacterium]